MNLNGFRNEQLHSTLTEIEIAGVTDAAALLKHPDLSMRFVAALHPWLNEVGCRQRRVMQIGQKLGMTPEQMADDSLAHLLDPGHAHACKRLNALLTISHEQGADAAIHCLMHAVLEYAMGLMHTQKQPNASPPVKEKPVTLADCLSGDVIVTMARLAQATGFTKKDVVAAFIQGRQTELFQQVTERLKQLLGEDILHELESFAERLDRYVLPERFRQDPNALLLRIRRRQQSPFPDGPDAS